MAVPGGDAGARVHDEGGDGDISGEEGVRVAGSEVVGAGEGEGGADFGAEAEGADAGGGMGSR